MHAEFRWCALALSGSSVAERILNPECQIGGLKDLWQTMGMSFKKTFCHFDSSSSTPLGVPSIYFSINGRKPDHIF